MIILSNYLQHHLNAQETHTLLTNVVHETAQRTYLGLHWDETMATAAGQSRPLDGPAMEEVIVVFEIPNLQNKYADLGNVFIHSITVLSTSLQLIKKIFFHTKVS